MQPERRSVEIRLATAEDAASIAAIYEPAVTDSAVSFELVPPTADEMRGRISTVLATTPWLVCVCDGAVLGYAYASKHRDRAAYRWAVEVSAYVSADAQRRGIARALYTSLFAILRLQGYRIAYAGITLPNDASVALHTKLGFTRIGVFEKIGCKAGAWHDVLWLQREISPRDREPEPPTPLAAMVDLPAFRDALASGSAFIVSVS